MPERVEAVCTIIVVIVVITILCVMESRKVEGYNYNINHSGGMPVTDCIQVNCDNFNSTTRTNITNNVNITLTRELRAGTITVSDCLQIMCADKR